MTKGGGSGSMRYDTASRSSQSFSVTAWIGFLLSSAAFILLLLSVFGFRLGWWHFTTALQISQWAGYAAIIGFALLLFRLLSGRAHGTRVRHFIPLIIGIIFALPIAGAGLWWNYTEQAYPPINDITTDTADPPVFWDMPNPMDYPGAKTAELQRRAYPDIVPLQLDIAPNSAYQYALQTVKDNGWKIIAADPADGRIEATADSFLFGFTDEVLIRIASSGTGSRVDVRSRSRRGQIDRGVNAKRIRTLLAEFENRANDRRP